MGKTFSCRELREQDLLGGECICRRRRLEPGAPWIRGGRFNGQILERQAGRETCISQASSHRRASFLISLVAFNSLLDIWY